MNYNNLSLPAINSSSRFTVASAPYYPIVSFTPLPCAVNASTTWQILNVGDPQIIFADNYYYSFSTDVMVGEGPFPLFGPILSSIQIRRSLDLIKWDWYGTAISAVPADAQVHVPNATKVWAPHVEKINDRFFLYYSVSNFGTALAYIGVLSSTSVTGPWTNLGEVYKTNTGSAENAIDPNICWDKDNNPWLIYGSYFTGLYIIRINPDTGKILSGATKYNIAQRHPVQGLSAIEGGFIIYNPDFNYYYLFSSYGQCCDQGAVNAGEPPYEMRVSRAVDITGVYLDFNGLSATDIDTIPSLRVGNKLAGGYKFKNTEGWLAPGHNAVFRKGNDYFTVHHARADKDWNWQYLHVRRIVWSDNGWPLFLPQRYAGETLQKITSGMLVGNYQHLTHIRVVTTQASSFDMSLLSNGVISGTTVLLSSFWNNTGTNTLNLSFSSASGGYFIDTCKVWPAWDWELNKSTICYTGINLDGNSVWGKKV